MEWFSDELLFYGSLLMAGAVLLIMVIWLCVSYAGLARLNARLDAEYGEREKAGARRKGRS